MPRRGADAHDGEVTTALARATRLLEPLTIIVMGHVVLFIALATLLPIFKLNELTH